ncbi:BatB protein [Flavobacterium album]|uniref:BatB protein n=1 Tax=Flavobacterium album TaxID=2175091 RepID=A0A2S1QV99_9FLAO|nr:VWA domain-containing protein [Flavobacterium album]AWH84338.1 BatB protein [Flavobacterium album]
MYVFDKPIYFYLLAIIPVLAGLYLYDMYWKKKKQREFGSPEMVGRLSPENSPFKAGLKFIIVLLVLTGLILALVNPRAGIRKEVVKTQGADIVFAIDVSKSMLAEDIAPNRLEKSKQIVSQVMKRLGADRVGIIGYAGSAFPVLPITTDYGVAKMLLEGMDTDMVSSQGTAINEALLMSASYFDDPKAGKMVVLLSDGEDHGQDSNNAAEELAKRGIKMVTVGIGTEKGTTIPLKRNGVTESYKRDNEGQIVTTKLYPGPLKELAKITGGGYITGNDSREVADYVAKALENIDKKGFATRQVSDYDSQYQWFLAAALLLLIIDMFLLERKTAWIMKLNLFNEKVQ